MDTAALLLLSVGKLAWEEVRRLVRGNFFVQSKCGESRTRRPIVDCNKAMRAAFFAIGDYHFEMASRKSSREKFSVVKAVKANARRSVGQPKPERVIEEKPRTPRRKEKHPPTMADLLDSAEE